MNNLPGLCARCQAPLPPNFVGPCRVCGLTVTSRDTEDPPEVFADLHFGAPLRLKERLSGLLLDVFLFVFTLGIGWLVWFSVTVRHGMTPAGKLRDEVFIYRGQGVAGTVRLLLRQVLLIAAWALFLAGVAGGLPELFSFGPEVLRQWVAPTTLATVVLVDLFSVFLAGHTRYLDQLFGIRLAHGAGHTFTRFS